MRFVPGLLSLAALAAPVLATAAEAPTALQAGAEGVGLLRTEFIFQERTEPPSEEEQYAVYRQVAGVAGAQMRVWVVADELDVLLAQRLLVRVGCLPRAQQVERGRMQITAHREAC